MLEVASLDEEYKELVEAVDAATPLSDIRSDSPLRNYKQQWEQLPTFEISPGKKLVIYNQCIIVPKELHQGIIKKHHKSHLGERVLTETLQRQYLWPNLKNEVMIATRGCEPCTEFQSSKSLGKVVVMVSMEALEPMESIYMDHFSMEQGNHLGVVD